MRYPGLEHYLERLYGNTQADTNIWLDNEGRAQGRYFHSTLTSAFQPIRDLTNDCIIGYEGFARSYSGTDQGLCIWKLLDHAANDDESVELDRLCRMLHAINFFRQHDSAGKDLYLSVHARLLAAVEGNHGMAFSRVLKVLALPKERVVLQLPAITEHQNWLLNYVVDNYRRNGFRIAVTATDVSDALALLFKVRPEVIKIDARQVKDNLSMVALLRQSAARGSRIIFKRVEDLETYQALMRVGEQAGIAIHAQGYAWDMPKAMLGASAPAINSLPAAGSVPVGVKTG